MHLLYHYDHMYDASITANKETFKDHKTCLNAKATQWQHFSVFDSWNLAGAKGIQMIKMIKTNNFIYWTRHEYSLNYES